MFSLDKAGSHRNEEQEKEKAILLQKMLGYKA